MSISSVLGQFRQSVYQKFRQRADAALDLVDAMTTAGVVASPVAMSEEPPFRRKFSMVYDVLENGDVDLQELGQVLYEAQPADCETMAGYEVYAVDATDNPRPAVETLPEPVLLKADKATPAVPGWKFSWLVRLVQRGTSWVGPQDVQQIPAASTANQVAGAQVAALDTRSDRPKVAVLDSGYFNHVFLALCVALKTVVALVRMRRNCTLYEQPVPKPAGSKGAPRKHGPKFKLGQPPRPPDRTDTFILGSLTVVLSAWHGLHLRKVPTLVGLALRVEFLKADGTPRYQRPLWLFWTGPLTVALRDIGLMYLWRFAIEIVFTQMTKTDVLAAGTSGDDVTDFDIPIRHHHAVNQELDQLPFPLKGRLRQSLLNALTELFNRSHQGSYFGLAIHTRFELLGLVIQPLLFLLQVLAASLILRHGNDLVQIRLRQALQLMLEADACLAQILAARLEFLRQPMPTLRALQGLFDRFGVGQHLTQILPYQFIQLLGGNETRRTFFIMTGLHRMQLAPTDIVGIAAHLRARHAGALAHTATDQRAQQIVVRLVIALSELLILCQFGLYQIELLLTHNRRNVRHQNPFFGSRQHTARRGTPDRFQCGAANLRWAGVRAHRIHLAGIDRIGQNAPQRGWIPAFLTLRRRNLARHEVFRQAKQAVSLFLIVDEHLGDDRRLGVCQAHSRWIARPVGIHAKPIRRTCPG
jgi:hypothetical protein